jgi:hypothetical protein
MKTCALCRGEIKPATPIVEMVGGLLDPEDPEFFVTDEEILVTSYVHRDCLMKKLQKA